MNEKKLRGYTVPCDYQGSDAERIQQALDESSALHIGRVVLNGSYLIDKTLVIREDTELVFDHATVKMTAEAPLLTNYAQAHRDELNSYSFQDAYVRLTGIDSTLKGDILFCNAWHLYLSDLTLTGKLHLEYVWEARLERITADSVIFGRSCNNIIAQGITALTSDTGIIIDPTVISGCELIAKEPFSHELILQDSTMPNAAAGILISCDDVCTLYNVQIDHISAKGTTVVIGKEGDTFAPGSCYDLTAVQLQSASGETLRIVREPKNSYFA